MLTRLLRSSRYGTPILVDAYTKELFAARADENPDVDEVAKRVVSEMTNTLSERLHAMTINASDWYGFFSGIGDVWR